MGKIYFNGVELTETYGMEILGRGTYGAPARDIEQVHVPGRNGDLLFDNGGYLNFDLTYPECCIAENFPVYGAALRNFLLSSPGYHKLYDSYDMRHYRLAEYRGPFLPDVHTARGNDSAVFDLTFNCKPFRYLQETLYGNAIYSGYTGTTSYSGTDGHVVLPLASDGEYAVRYVNGSSAAKTMYAYKVGTFGPIGNCSVPANGEATLYVSADVSEVIYIYINTAATDVCQIYCNGQLVYSHTGNADEQTTKIFNPYPYTARPLIRIKNFEGSITANGKTLICGYQTLYEIMADSDLHLVYYESSGQPASQFSGEFIELIPGLNTITVASTAHSSSTDVEIFPRYCTL